ncbi:putative kinesin heavy chain isoform [Hordeum vulgare]|nr:putative kinesin heavy chain isoform [Hordeum vulgare]
MTEMPRAAADGARGDAFLAEETPVEVGKKRTSESGASRRDANGDWLGRRRSTKLERCRPETPKLSPPLHTPRARRGGFGKNKLQETYEKLVEDLNNLLNSQDNIPQSDHHKDVENITISVDNNMGNMNEQLVAKDVKITKLKVDVDQLKFIHVSQSNCIRDMKNSHLKEKEKMSTNKRSLKFCWANLKKEKEKLNG